ncbi:MAG: hypothetical protein HFF50_07745 [Lawsonibacter sp.]|nr:hypothetical protein [Lawsonibacter sp.]
MGYPNLNTLLHSEPRAKSYFDTLPDYVQSQIITRGNSIHSLDSLQSYAENLTRGDG